MAVSVPCPARSQSPALSRLYWFNRVARIARRAQIISVLIVARRGCCRLPMSSKLNVEWFRYWCVVMPISWPKSPGPAHHSCRASMNHCQCDPRPLVGGVVGVGEGDQGRRGTPSSRRNRIQPVQVIVLLGRRHAPGTVVGEANLAHQRRGSQRRNTWRCFCPRSPFAAGRPRRRRKPRWRGLPLRRTTTFVRRRNGTILLTDPFQF